MTESPLANIARRGLLLPAETREQIRATGIRCRPQLEIVYQQGARQWKLRGEESGGAVELLGHYAGIVDSHGGAMPCRHSHLLEATALVNAQVPAEVPA